MILFACTCPAPAPRLAYVWPMHDWYLACALPTPEPRLAHACSALGLRLLRGWVALGSSKIVRKP